MKVFQDPIADTYYREDGQPGYGCARCGNGYATAETRDDLGAHLCLGFDRDIDTFTNAQGIFDDGYTAEDVTSITGGLSTVEFMCVWQYRDNEGFGGHSEFVGRDINADGSTGPWRLLDDTFWLYLHDATKPVALDEVESFLDDTTEFHTQDLTAYLTRSGVNVAYEDRRF